MKWYAVAYGSTIRLAKEISMKNACLYCFGICDPDRMTVMKYPKNPKYISVKLKTEYMGKLKQRHLEKTGCEIK